MLDASHFLKMSIFPGHNHLLTTGTDDQRLTLWLLPRLPARVILSVGPSVPVVSRYGYDLDIGHFQQVASMVSYLVHSGFFAQFWLVHVLHNGLGKPVIGSRRESTLMRLTWKLDYKSQPQSTWRWTAPWSKRRDDKCHAHKTVVNINTLCKHMDTGDVCFNELWHWSLPWLKGMMVYKCHYCGVVSMLLLGSINQYIA